MIQAELVENGERIRHYSDENLKIRQIETGISYEDAVDVVPCKYTYEETDEQIPIPEIPENPEEPIEINENPEEIE